MKLMKPIVVILFWLLAASAGAQGILLKGEVRDVVTGDGLHGARVVLKNAEGRPVGETSARLVFDKHLGRGSVELAKLDKRGGAKFTLVAPREGRYEIVVSHVGYDEKRIRRH